MHWRRRPKKFSKSSKNCLQMQQCKECPEVARPACCWEVRNRPKTALQELSTGSAPQFLTGGRTGVDAHPIMGCSRLQCHACKLQAPHLINITVPSSHPAEPKRTQRAGGEWCSSNTWVPIKTASSTATPTAHQGYRPLPHPTQLNWNEQLTSCLCPERFISCHH